MATDITNEAFQLSRLVSLLFVTYSEQRKNVLKWEFLSWVRFFVVKCSLLVLQNVLEFQSIISTAMVQFTRFVINNKRPRKTKKSITWCYRFLRRELWRQCSDLDAVNTSKMSVIYTRLHSVISSESKSINDNVCHAYCCSPSQAISNPSCTFCFIIVSTRVCHMSDQPHALPDLSSGLKLKASD